MGNLLLLILALPILSSGHDWAKPKHGHYAASCRTGRYLDCPGPAVRHRPGRTAGAFWPYQHFPSTCHWKHRPGSAGERRVDGAINRENDSGLLQTAVSHNATPWSLALANQLQVPLPTGNWRPILVPGEQPIREVPVGAYDLALTPETPVAGQGLTAHLNLADVDGATAVALDNAFAVTNLGHDLIAVSGTGAFTEPGEHELSVQIGDAPIFWRSRGLGPTRLDLPTIDPFRRSGRNRSSVD